jgi:hypothetical protein
VSSRRISSLCTNLLLNNTGRAYSDTSTLKIQALACPRGCRRLEPTSLCLNETAEHMQHDTKHRFALTKNCQQKIRAVTVERCSTCCPYSELEFKGKVSDFNRPILSVHYCMFSCAPARFYKWSCGHEQDPRHVKGEVSTSSADCKWSLERSASKSRTSSCIVSRADMPASSLCINMVLHPTINQQQTTALPFTNFPSLISQHPY